MPSFDERSGKIYKEYSFFGIKNWSIDYWLQPSPNLPLELNCRCSTLALELLCSSLTALKPGPNNIYATRRFEFYN